MQKNRTIIYICENDLSQQIGGTIHVKEVLASLNKLHPDITLIAPDYHNTTIEIPTGIKTIFIKTGNRRIIKWLNFYFASTMQILLIRMKHPKILVYSREMPYNIILPIIIRIFRIPFFVELNGVFLNEMRDLKYTKYAYQISKIIEKSILSKADKIICVSDEIAYTVSKLLYLNHHRFIIIPNGTNLKLFYQLPIQECRAILNLDSKSFIIGFIGSCYPYHDIDTLISSIPFLKDKVPEIQVIIVGDGTMLVQWKKLTERLELTKNVVYTGYVPFQNANLYINSFDICYASYKNGTSVFPMKILDYMACNKPIITSKIPTITKYFKETETFRLVQPENIESLVHSIQYLFNNRHDQICKHRDFVLNNFTWDHTARKIIDTINRSITSTRYV